jgi:putative ABC transport system substrate-binding protein
MRRRDLLAFLGSATVACSVGARAQPPTKVARVGILSDETSSLAAKTLEPFAEGLRDLGYIEGQNIAFERRYAQEKDEILHSLAGKLVRAAPDVIVAIGTPATQAAKNASQSIPIVFARVSDPVGLGFVASLARPGGNLTGLSVQTRELAAKRLELLITAVPAVKRVGVLWDPRLRSSRPEVAELDGAARSLNLELFPAQVPRPEDFEPAIRAMAEQHADGLIMVPGPIFTEHIQWILDLTDKVHLPAMCSRKEHVEAGCLMSYGTNYSAMYRRAAAYVDKILKGAKPADLPVEQPTKFELIINLRTAMSIGLTIPPILLARADEVIE